jgi:hypothetical protein
MPNLGLWTRLCPNCKVIHAHRTLYIKTECHGKSKWYRIFWACTACNSLNHVTLPVYRLEAVPLELPTPLAVCTVKVLKRGPKSLDQLVQALRGNCEGVSHVFTSDVKMVLEYLKGQGEVTEEMDDLTDRTIEELRNRKASSRHLGECPAEAGRGAMTKGLVSVYAQRRQEVEDGDEPKHAGRLKLTPIGLLCVACGYHRIDPTLLANP